MRRLVGDSRALEGATQTIAGLPGTLGAMLRNAFLRLVLAKCSPTAEVCYGTILSQPGAVIGDRVYLGCGAKILGGIRIGNDVVVAPNAVVTRDVPDKAVVGGIPARVLSEEGSHGYVSNVYPEV